MSRRATDSMIRHKHKDEGTMAIYMVGYDLNNPGQDYGKLIREIEKYDHCKCLKSGYFIDTEEKASEIRDKLAKHLDKNDTLFVNRLKRSWAANRVTKCTRWLKDDLRSWT
ncbi:MAG: hypothetical protein DI532_12465 [Azospirillum brasilense]|nr:MAG: hypothetical protein DI532_12465 [Azospirillum brasilense]